MKKYFILYLLTTLAFTCFAKEKTKMIRQGNAEVELFNNDWKFYRYGLQADGNRIEEPQNLSGTDLNDSNWRKLTLPHDFGIEGPFRMDLAGNTGRLPFQGIGWYRKSFKLSNEFGNLVPTANHKLKIDVTGCGELVATDNGDPTSFVPFQSNQREAFNGLALAIVKAKTGEKGNIKIKVDSPGLKPAQIQILSK